MMMTIKKIYVWCVQHWRWLVFSAVAIVAYALGKKNAHGLFKQAKLARDQYKKEAELIEAAHKEKSNKIKKSEEIHSKELSKIEKKKNISIKALDEEKRKEIEEHLNDPEKLDDALKDLGIKEV